MASVISQLTSLVAGTLAKASVINNEFLQIINLVSGVSTDKRMKVVCDDDTNATLIVVQNGDGTDATNGGIANFQTGAGLMMKVPVSGVPVDATDITDKGYVDGKRTGWSHSVFDANPSVANADETPYAMFMVPETGTYTITKVLFAYSETTGVAGDNAKQAIFKLRKAPVGTGTFADVVTITTSKTLNATAGVAYGTDVSPDVALTSGDVLLFYCTTAEAGYRLRKLTLSIVGYKTP